MDSIPPLTAIVLLFAVNVPLFVKELPIVSEVVPVGSMNVPAFVTLPVTVKTDGAVNVAPDTTAIFVMDVVPVPDIVGAPVVVPVKLSVP